MMSFVLQIFLVRWIFGCLHSWLDQDIIGASDQVLAASVVVEITNGGDNVAEPSRMSERCCVDTLIDLRIINRVVPVSPIGNV